MGLLNNKNYVINNIQEENKLAHQKKRKKN